MVRGATRKSSYRKPFIALAAIAVVVSVFSWYRSRPPKIEPVLADVVEEPVAESVSPQKIIGEYDIAYQVQEGDTLSDIFSGHEIPFAEIVTLEQAGDEGFDFKDVQVGRTVYYSLYDDESDLRLHQVFYQPDLNRVIHATQTSGGWLIEEQEIVYDRRQRLVSGEVEASLYLSALDQGVDEAAILRFADVFAWDIDFALQTRSGDTYKFIYDERFLDDEFIASGRILAGEYVNNGTTFRAFYFEQEEGVGAYFDEEGNALQKAFLKAPVNYRYVTSGFSSARFHPVIGKVMPHNGVDYAAAYGTPIIAIGDGIVSDMGWMGAYGNRIEVKHGDRYGSQYSHMSSFVSGMSVGDKIEQGQVVGYVGSTGYSTGNHVHFSITDRGSYINPDTVDVPDGEPVSEENRKEFFTLVEERLLQLESQ
jgi:murein DD-endopeptidase MepM/ murein hydrolase activator NlpD